MGFISKLFGGNKEDNALREAFEQIRHILEDEQFQLDMIHPAMKAMIESRLAYDQDPNGTGPFGFSETNPIPVNGSIGQLAYLSKLETVACAPVCAIVICSRYIPMSWRPVRFDRRSPGSILRDGAYTVRPVRARHGTTSVAPPSATCRPRKCTGSVPAYPQPASGRHRAS